MAEADSQGGGGQVEIGLLTTWSGDVAGYLCRVGTSGGHDLGAIAFVAGQGDGRHRVGGGWDFKCEEGRVGRRADPLEQYMCRLTTSVSTSPDIVSSGESIVV